jgi:hypothetical protein
MMTLLVLFQRIRRKTVFNKTTSTVIRNLAILWFLAFSLGGCATPAPTLDTSPDAEMTFDGLYEVQNSAADIAWATPGVDLSGYTKIMHQDVGVEFRPGGESGRLSMARSSSGPFEVTEEGKARFREIAGEIALEELGKSEKFVLVNEPGPDVLLISTALLDVVSFVPPEPMGRADIYLNDIGEVTFVLEIRDSITGAIFIRAIDRDAVGDDDMMNRATRASNTADVKRLIRRWMTMLREGLDSFSGYASAAE